MNLKGNKVLITGGSNGIGLGLSGIFSSSGSSVIIVSRNPEKLEKAAKKYPGAIPLQYDLSIESERIELYERIKKEHPDLNVLINNAGIQEAMRVSDPDFWEKSIGEISINLKAPLHLISLFLPLIQGNKKPAIINVSSGLAFVPMSFAPVYCATKAAIRSFTQSLRFQVDGKVEVIEIIPPAVNTDLGGPGKHNFGVPLEEFTLAVKEGLEAGKKEITYGTSQDLYGIGRNELDQSLKRMNSY